MMSGKYVLAQFQPLQALILYTQWLNQLPGPKTIKIHYQLYQELRLDEEKLISQSECLNMQSSL